MKKYLVVMMLAVASLSLPVSDAEAKRLGNAGAIAKQIQNLARHTPTRMTNAMRLVSQANTSTQVPEPKPSNLWVGMLAGVLSGLGMEALLLQSGLGGALGGIVGAVLMLTLFGVVMVGVMRLFSRKDDSPRMLHEPVLVGMGAGGARTATLAVPHTTVQGASAASGNPTHWGIPVDFDVSGFLRNAKTCFIRLQAAWDKTDIDDIRAFTTPEMFAELKMQLHERGAIESQTDVAILNAELLGVETTRHEYLASVKFSGMMRISKHAMAEPYIEVWNLAKPKSGLDGWTLAGIQQLQ